MNLRMIFFIIGRIMHAEALLLMIPMSVGIYYHEQTVWAFIIPVVLLFVLGFLFCCRKPDNQSIYAKEGLLVVALCWLFLSLFGALPFFISGQIPNFIDCLFETVSGFSTTGASILPDVEALSHSMLFWRSFTHWIGGMGVLVFVMALLPLAGGGRAMHIMRAESTGPHVGKIVSRISVSAKILYAIYFALTIILVILLLVGGMSLFDALLHAFGTAGTGGFGIKSNSVAYYNSPYIDNVIAIFMILFGINFQIFYLLLLRHFKEVWKSEELRWYLIIVIASFLIISMNILPMYKGIWDSMRIAFFQVSSIITTTGYSTTDFNLWPTLSKTVLLLLMFFGACAGSTAGGFKISRVIILFKSMIREIRRMIHPHSVSSVKLDGNALDDHTISSVQNYLSIYFVMICVSVIIVSADRFDLVTSFTSVISCINNVGPGLELVGPMGNYSAFSAVSKLTLTFNMLIGRLEIIPIMILFTPSVWRDILSAHRPKQKTRNTFRIINALSKINHR